VVYLTVESGGGGGTDSAFAIPDYLEFNVPSGSTDTLIGQTVLISTNAPANYSGFVLGGPFSFVSIPDSAGLTNDSVYIVVNPIGLSDGIYSDSVVFDVYGVDDPVLLPVVLIIGDSLKQSSLSNYPNPFNPATYIMFTLEQSSDIQLDVYNILGQHVTTLVDEFMPAGTHQVMWDGRDASGVNVSSGIYFYRLSDGLSIQTRKMILLK
jgi:hypothetical protein